VRGWGLYVYERRRLPRPAATTWWFALFIAAALLGMTTALILQAYSAAFG
jgi:hypothetical protein